MYPNLESVQVIFEKMRENGFDPNGTLKYGFFFFSKSKDNLEKIYNELKDHKYTKESIHKADDEYVLQVSKQEVLEPNKLHRRNISFNELAVYFDSFYDGWDVGKV